MTTNMDSMSPTESVLRTLQRCIDKGGMTYAPNGDLGVLAAAIVRDLGMEPYGWIVCQDEWLPPHLGPPAWPDAVLYRVSPTPNGSSSS